MRQEVADLRWAAMSDAEKEAAGEEMRCEARMADEEAKIAREAVTKKG